MSKPSGTLLQATALTKSFHKSGKEISVLEGVNLTIQQGEMCSIQGQSGVGKSTLLHVLGTLDRPTSGEVTYQGRNVFDFDDAEMAAFRNRSIGFVFQFHHLLPELTALENVMVPGLIARQSAAQIRTSAADLLADAGLAHRMDHRPAELSGGEQQRVAIARALVMKPDIVFADEPTGNLDQRTSSEIHDLLVRINQSHNVAFVIVTHNTPLATLMPRKYVMRKGCVHEATA
jgi:lipoprotein-releasing system ATP-binding protein